MPDSHKHANAPEIPDMTERMRETNRLSREAYAAMGYDVDKSMDRSAFRIGTLEEKNAWHEEFHRRVKELFGDDK
jgi:hypothetical protein